MFYALLCASRTVLFTSKKRISALQPINLPVAIKKNKVHSYFSFHHFSFAAMHDGTYCPVSDPRFVCYFSWCSVGNFESVAV